MLRKIIRIDVEKCTGCGICIPDCPEGALQIIDGKVRLVSDLFCDGLGACLGSCPLGAITVEEREAEPYDEKKVMENIVKAGEKTVAAHLSHLDEHGEKVYLSLALEFLRENGIGVPDFRGESSCVSGGCPGSRIIDSREEGRDESLPVPGPAQVPRLRQWPVQLKLVSPSAPYFRDADLLIAADCVPFALAGFHEEFLKGRALAVFCPKLDGCMGEYIEKLALIIKEGGVRSVTALRMQVPCCGGIVSAAREAVRISGKDIDVTEKVVSLKGDLL